MLKELERQEKELFASLHIVRDAIAKEKQSLAEQNFGIRVGSIVKNRKGVEHKVIKVDTRWDGKPWIHGSPKKKDGTFGTALRKIYNDWELVK